MSPTRAQTRRIAVPEDPAVRGFDYADAFWVRAPAPEERSAETLARIALERAPVPVRLVVRLAQRGVLRLRAARGPREDQVFGWQIVHSDPDELRLASDGPLLRAQIVARRLGPDEASVATYVWFSRPQARWVWPVVAPLHRAVAPRLLRYAASSSAA